MRRPIALAVSLALCLIPLRASAGGPSYPETPQKGDVSFDTDKARYELGPFVTIELRNDSAETVELTGDWTIRTKDGREVSLYAWAEEDKTVAPGESRTWTWEQNDGGCYGICQNIRWGDPAEPGRYIAVAPTSVGELTATFDLGEYFTIGFRHQARDEFTVFVRTRDEVEVMTEQAETPKDERNMIVSGKVRRGLPYNEPWSYTMGPGSIVLGEAFIEVCDGNPRYVEKHRDEWMGERWCPWSSFVERVGR